MYLRVYQASNGDLINVRNCPDDKNAALGYAVSQARGYGGLSGILIVIEVREVEEYVRTVYE